MSEAKLTFYLFSNVKAECAHMTAIAQEVLPPAWIKISIKLGIKCLGVELLETIDVAT